jgi:hypothetical protein
MVTGAMDVIHKYLFNYYTVLNDALDTFIKI